MYDKYYNTTNEVEAREAGDNAKRKAKRIDPRILEIAQSSYGRFRKRYVRTGTRNSLKETRNSRYQEEIRGNGLRYNQAAYHGTPYRFDEFSLENIGTGEGAQAHGWGLYFAENKYVSEDYRKTLSDTNGIGTEIKVDNKTYKKVATNTYRNKDDLSENVDDYLNKALNFIETKGTKKDALKYIQKQIDTNKDAGYFDDAVYYIRIKDALNEIKQAKITKYADDYGQLFKVDIPDSDEMLDENKSFKEQSEKVQKAFKKLLNDEYFSYGSDFKEIKKDLPKPKIQPDIISSGVASLINNIYQQNNNVKYYQGNNYVDLSNEFEKVPTFEEVEKYLYEILDSGVSFDTKTKGYKIDIKQTKVKRRDNKPTNVINKLTKKGNPKHLNKSAIKRNNKYLKTIEQLIKNAELKRNEEKDTDGYENNKKNEKPHVKQYYNFDVPVRIGEIIYTVRLQAEEWEHDKSENGVKTVHLYNIYETKKSSRLDPTDKMPIKTAREDKNNLRQKNSNVNSLTEDAAQANLFYDNITPRKLRLNIKGSFVPAENLIELFKDADESTIVHELAHWYLDLINEYAQYSEELTQDLEKVRAFLKNDGGEFTREQHEKFARAFEAYIRTGYARNNRLKKIFEDFKNWLISIYDDIKKIIYTENGVDKYFTDDEVKTIQNLFDRLLTSEKERIRTTVFDKVQEVEDKINSIKENEKKELQQLDEIYKDHISALNRKSDKKRSVQEYLDLADKMTSRETQIITYLKLAVCFLLIIFL